MAEACSIVDAFKQEALFKASLTVRATAGDIITKTLGKVEKRFSETPRTPREIEACADGHYVLRISRLAPVKMALRTS